MKPQERGNRARDGWIFQTVTFGNDFLYKNGVLKLYYCQFSEVDKTRWSIITDE